jgi:ABC-2 type transport system ATP-binding protein
MFAIEIQNIHKRYQHVHALNGIDLCINRGEFFGLLGLNGAGKTTLIKILSGLIYADEGQVKIHGHDVISDFRAARRTLGIVPQELTFDPFLTVYQTLHIQSGYYGLRANNDWIDEILTHLGLRDKADTNMRALSGGMKRRVLIAQALVHRPPVIVLDEPTTGVDVEMRQMLWKFIRQLNDQGHTIILTTHYLEEAEQLCNRIALLRSGTIAALDNKQTLLQRASGLQLVICLAEGNLPPALRALECGMLSSRKSQHVLRLNTYDEVESILAQCRQAGCTFEEIEIRKADLEDVFMQLVQPTCPDQAEVS